MIRQAVVVLLLALCAPSLHAQLNANLGKDRTLADSAVVEYDYLFPIFGKEVVARGFDIPYPVGVNVLGMFMTQPIEVNDLQLSFGEGAELQPVPFIQFGESTSTIANGSLRLDLWLFPFLNVYGMAGVAQSNTTVVLTSPLEMESSVDQQGQFYGFGFTTAFGVWDHWASVDLNWAWADLEKLSAPVRTRILGVRMGHTFDLNDRGMKLAAWVGLMNGNIESVTDGSIKLNEALPQDVFDRIDEILDGYQDTEWYQDLPNWQQAAVDALVQQLDDTSEDRRNAPVNYNINKALAQPTNLLLGAQWEINKEWVLRTEAGMIGRWSIMLNLNYRFRL